MMVIPLYLYWKWIRSSTLSVCVFFLIRKYVLFFGIGDVDANTVNLFRFKVILDRSGRRMSPAGSGVGCEAVSTLGGRVAAAVASRTTTSMTTADDVDCMSNANQHVTPRLIDRESSYGALSVVSCRRGGYGRRPVAMRFPGRRSTAAIHAICVACRKRNKGAFISIRNCGVRTNRPTSC